MEKGVKFLKNTSRTGARRDRAGATGEDDNSFDDIGLSREAGGLQQDPYSASGHSNSSRRSTIGSASSSFLPNNVPTTPMVPFATSPQPQHSPFQHRPHESLPLPSQILQQQQQQQQQHQTYPRQLPSISHIIATAAPPGRGTAVTTH